MVKFRRNPSFRKKTIRGRALETLNPFFSNQQNGDLPGYSTEVFNYCYVSGKYEEIRKNRNENASADVCRQITRQNHQCRLAEQFWH